MHIDEVQIIVKTKPKIWQPSKILKSPFDVRAEESLFRHSAPADSPVLLFSNSMQERTGENQCGLITKTDGKRESFRAG
jgi:hypothetical protein